MTANAEQIPENGLYRIGVISNAKMFKVVDCILQVEDGKMTARMTMSGSGYGYLYLGTGEEADAVSRENWSPYREDEQGRHVFDLEIPALDTELSVASFSIKYEKWYDRTLIFTSEGIREYNSVMPDGVYDGQLMSDTVLNGSPCVLSVSDGEMIGELSVPETVTALEIGSSCAAAENGLCFVNFSSMDLRIPIRVSEGDVCTEGWMKLLSSGLGRHDVGAANGMYCADVTTDSSLLRLTDCILEISENGMTATVTAKNQNFKYLYMGTMSEAMNDEADWIEAVPDADGRFTYQLPIETLDNEIPVATYSTRKKMWYDRTIRIDSSSLVSIDAEETEALSDGSVVPDEFSFAGGSGRITITCPWVKTDEAGQTWAEIRFSSSHYTQVKVGDVIYPCTCTDETSAVIIPVAVNQNMTIIGTTTAMSQPHDIEYTLRIEVKNSENK